MIKLHQTMTANDFTLNIPSGFGLYIIWKEDDTWNCGSVSIQFELVGKNHTEQNKSAIMSN